MHDFVDTVDSSDDQYVHMHLWMFIYCSMYLLSSSEKHALFLADEYYQSNITVTFWTILLKDFIFNTNPGIRFIFKSTNDERITENICEIKSCM